MHTAPEKPGEPLSLRLAPQQDDKVETVESRDDYVGAAVDINSSTATACKRIDISTRVDRVQYDEHHLSDMESAHRAELEGSFRHHDIDYSPGLISVTAVQPVAELFHSFDLLDCTRRNANGAVQ